MKKKSTYEELEKRVKELEADLECSKQKEEAFRKNEEKHRNLFDNMGEGFALHKMVYDESGNPIDYIFLEVNDAFEKLTGLKKEDVLGKKVTEVLPGIRKDPSDWIGYYAKVVLTGQSFKFNTYSKMLNKDFEGIAYKSQPDHFVVIFSDVTEHKKAEETLKTLNNKHASMIANIGDVIGVMGIDGVMKYKSPNIEKLFGWKPEDLVGTDGWETVHPDDKDRLQEEFSALLQKPSFSRAVEYRYKCKNGSYKWIHLTATNCLDDPNIEGVLLNYHDITERKQAENALLLSEEKFRKAFNTSPDSVNINRLDDGVYVSVNRGFTKIMGYSESDVIGRSSSEINIWKSSEDRNKLVKELRKRGEVQNLEAQFRKKDGSIAYGLMSATIIKLNGNLYILSITRDITNRKQAEEALRASEEKFRIIAENISDVIWTRDIKTFADIYVSPSIFSQTGFTVEERLSQTLEENTDLDSVEKITKLFNEEMALEEDGLADPSRSRNIEANLYRKDGTTFPAEMVVSFIRDENGKAIAIAGITRDITNRKQAEKEKLQAQKVAAEQSKMALVGQVAGKMAHDFNNILGVIMGNTELTLIDCQEPQTRKTLELIFEQTLRGKNLTKNLVAFARDQEPRQEFFMINEKIDLVLSLLRRELNGIEVQMELSPGLPHLFADPGMIEHAFVNLIQNSIHALSMVEHPIIIIKTYATMDNVICFEIIDNGCGVPNEHIDSIYEPAFTLKGNKDVTGSYKKNIKGTGYGMANIKKYIEQHKGSISIDSEVGVGTTFTVCLPIIKKELTKKEKAKIQEEITHFGKYILLIEDEAGIANTQYRTLTEAPCMHRVDKADNGQVAMDLFNRNEYDFISLDYMLPGDINGIDVYNHIRKTNQTVPILFISGNIDFLESIKKMKQKDIYIDHLSKPCQLKDYVDSIERLLKKQSKTF